MACRRSTRSFAISACTFAAALVASMAVMQAPAQAATTSGAFAVRGLGAQSCKDVTVAAQGDQAVRILESSSAWIAGYVSQFNRSNANIYEAIPVIDNAILAKLAINICRLNPDTLFEAVAASLIQSFSRGALSEESAITEIKYSGNNAVLRRVVVRLVQQELSKQGLLAAGSADGDYGPLSRRALSKFQESKGINVSGVPDAETLIHLFAMGEPVKDGSKK